MSELIKGAYKGLCNRSACLKPGADWWNYSTRAYYCRECAIEINRANCPDGLYLCVSPVSMPPTYDEERKNALKDAAGICSHIGTGSMIAKDKNGPSDYLEGLVKGADDCEKAILAKIN